MSSYIHVWGSCCCQSMNKFLLSKITIDIDLHLRIRGPRCPKRPQAAPGGFKRPQKTPGVSEAPRDPHKASRGLVLLGFRSIKNSSGVAPSAFVRAVFLLLVFTSACVSLRFCGVFLSDMFPSVCCFCLMFFCFMVLWLVLVFHSWWFICVFWCFLSGVSPGVCFLYVFLLFFLVLWLVLVFHNWCFICVILWYLFV